MPIAPAVLAALIGAAATATTTGLQLAGAFTPSTSGADQAAATAQAKATADQQTQQKNAAVQAAQQYAPNIQAQLGGAVSPDYYAQTAAAQTGNSDQLAAVRQALGMQGLAPSVNSGSLTAGSAQQQSTLPSSGGSNPQDLLSMLGLNNGAGGGQFHGGSA